MLLIDAAELTTTTRRVFVAAGSDESEKHPPANRRPWCGLSSGHPGIDGRSARRRSALHAHYGGLASASRCRRPAVKS